MYFNTCEKNSDCKNKATIRCASCLRNTQLKDNYKSKEEEFFKNLSRDEFLNLLKETGYEFEDGAGEVVFTDILENEKNM